MISDPKSWFIIGPGRTGSTLLSTIIANSIDCKYVLRLPRKMMQLREGDVFHTHNIDFLPLIADHTQCIISTRDIIDSTLSKIIAEHTKIYGYWTESDITKCETMSKVRIPRNVFEREIVYRTDFFKRLDKAKPKNSIIMPYENFKNDPTIIRDILSLPVVEDNVLPMHTPRIYEEWISNWDEVCEFITEYRQGKMIQKPCII